MSEGVLERAIDAVVRPAINAGVSPGAAIVVGRCREVLAERYLGVLAPGDTAVEADTVYDLSSLTKPLATLGCALSLAADGRIELDANVGGLLRELRGVSKEDTPWGAVTIAHLAGHAAGLPARTAYFESFDPSDVLTASEDAKRKIVEMACREHFVAPPGVSIVYSDVGYIVLGALLELIGGSGLDRIFARRIAGPLGLLDTGFRPLGGPSSTVGRADAERIAPTDVCPWRGRLVRAAVQDENAYAMGGVAGHAGLFSTARGVHAIVAEWEAAYAGATSLFDSDLVRRCWRGRGSMVAGSTWSLGWDTPTPGASSAGRLVSCHAFGHLGFTGTSVWVDLERDVHVVLLTNRVHPRKTDDRIRELRPRLHDAVFAVLDSATL